MLICNNSSEKSFGEELGAACIMNSIQMYTYFDVRHLASDIFSYFFRGYFDIKLDYFDIESALQFDFNVNENL